MARKNNFINSTCISLINGKPMPHKSFDAERRLQIILRFHYNETLKNAPRDES